MANHRFVQHDPTSTTYSARIRPEEWQKHEARIRLLHELLYTRREILDIITDEGSFHPSIGQLLSKMKIWGLKVYKIAASRAHRSEQRELPVPTIQSKSPIPASVHRTSSGESVVDGISTPSTPDSEKWQDPVQYQEQWEPEKKGRIDVRRSSQSSGEAQLSAEDVLHEARDLSSPPSEATGSARSVEVSSTASSLSHRAAMPMSLPEPLIPRLKRTLTERLVSASFPEVTQSGRALVHSLLQFSNRVPGDYPERSLSWKGIVNRLRSRDNVSAKDSRMVSVIGDCLSAAGFHSAAFTMYHDVLEYHRVRERSNVTGDDPGLLEKAAINCARTCVTIADVQYAREGLVQLWDRYEKDGATVAILKLYLSDLQSFSENAQSVAVNAMEFAITKQSEIPRLNSTVRLREHLAMIVMTQRYFTAMTGNRVTLPVESKIYNKFMVNDSIVQFADNLFRWCMNVVVDELAHVDLSLPLQSDPLVVPYQSLYFILLRAWVSQLSRLYVSRQQDIQIQFVKTLKGVFTEFETLAAVAYLIVADISVTVTTDTVGSSKLLSISTLALRDSFSKFLSPSFPLGSQFLKACFDVSNIGLRGRQRANKIAPGDVPECFLDSIWSTYGFETYLKEEVPVENLSREGDSPQSSVNLLESLLAELQQHQTLETQVLAPSPRSSTSSSLKGFREMAIRLKRTSTLSINSKKSKASSNAMSLDSRQSWIGSVAGFSMSQFSRDSMQISIKEQDEDM